MSNLLFIMKYVLEKRRLAHGVIKYTTEIIKHIMTNVDWCIPNVGTVFKELVPILKFTENNVRRLVKNVNN